MEINSSRTSAVPCQVLRNGSWKEIHCKRAESQYQPEKGGDDHHFRVPMTNPWVEHFRSWRRPRDKTSLVLRGAASLTSASQKSNLRMKKRKSASSSEQLRRALQSSSAFPVTDFMPANWTDEKHQSYIEYMETSFVKQYSYASMDENLQDPTLPKMMHYTSTISGQIFQGGCWREICYETAEPPPRTRQGYDFHSLMKSPWVQRFREPSKHKEIASPILRQENSCAYRKFEEMSGQNFDGDDIEEASRICKSSHQAVLSNRSHERENVNTNHTSAAKKDASNSGEQSRMAVWVHAFHKGGE